MKKTIQIDEENVLTLRQIAEELKRLYKWPTFDVNEGMGVICFTSADARLFNLHATGFAYEVKDGVEATEADDEHSVNFCEDLDYPDLVWAEDEEGNTVAIHN